MTLVQIACSTSNPADGTNFTGTTGLSIVTAGSAVRTWKSSVASRANTGIQIASGTTSEAVRTTVFTANLSAAWTDVLTTPAAAPSGSLNMLAVYSTSAAIFRIQWATDGRLFFYDNGGVARVVATAGTLALGTRYNFQMWFTVGTSSTTGVMHIVVTNLAGTVVATYDNTAANLGTVGASYFYIDTGGIAATYGHSEIQYNDGATAFIPVYSPPPALTASASSTGTASDTAATVPRLTATGASSVTATDSGAASPRLAASASSTGTATDTGAPTPALTASAVSTGTASDTASGSPQLAATAASTGTTHDEAHTSTATSATAASTGTATDTGSATPHLTATASDVGTATDSTTESTQVHAFADASSTGTATDVADAVATEFGTVTANSTGTATNTTAVTVALHATASSTATAHDTTDVTGTASVNAVSTGTASDTAVAHPKLRSTAASTGQATTVAATSVRLTSSASSTGTTSESVIAAPSLAAEASNVSTAFDTGTVTLFDVDVTAISTGEATDLAAVRPPIQGGPITVDLGPARWSLASDTDRWALEVGPPRWELA